MLAVATAAGCGQIALTEGGPRPAPPSAMTGAALVFDADLNAVVAVGGPAAPAQPALRTWSWDGHRWQQTDLDNRPPPRTAPLVASDPSGGVLLVGGQTGGTSTTSCRPNPPSTTGGGQPALCTGVATPVHQLSDVWSLPGHAWIRLAPPETVPPQGQLLAAEPALHTVVLVGRSRAFTPSATTGTWRWTDHGWSLMTTSSPQAAGSMAADPVTGKLIAYGGQEPFTPGPSMGGASTGGYSRTWQLTDSGWLELHLATVPERAQGVLTAGADGTRLLLITTTGHAWTWTGSTWQTYKITNARDAAASWQGSLLTAASGPRRRQVMVLSTGGKRGDTTWTLSDHAWQEQPTTP